MMRPAFNYKAIEPKVRAELHTEFGPNIVIGAEEVSDGRVFVKIVAPQFNGLSERGKQDAVWMALHRLGPDAQAVSLVLAFGIDEI